ncbi:MAG: insulinase family protein [candidate division KSB1 bacterium]|nr:insulinase family protein [candidate division KSB1 bacterium]
MRKHSLFVRIAVVALLVGVGAGGAVGQKKPKEQFVYPPLRQITLPHVERFTLKNGMTVFLVEDHDFPTIDLRAMIRTGAVYEPPEKVGLASLTGRVLRTGGSTRFPGDELDRLLEKLGASVETSIAESFGNLSASAFKEDSETLLAVVADLFQNPLFPEDKIELAKIEQRSAIARRNDDVLQITEREFQKLIYGTSSPYARHPEYATIDAITRDDIVAFHKRFFFPKNVLLAAWGDFSAKEMRRKIEKAFAGWKQGGQPVPPVPTVDYQYDFSVNYVHKPDVNQANIMLGHIGGVLNNPDYPALVVMNEILSMERLFKRVRIDEGLAYSVWGRYGAAYDHPGVFSCGCQTKSQSTVKAIRLIMEEVQKLRTAEVTDEELARAKDSFLNGFVFEFDSKAKIINRLLTYVYFGYPPDFMESIRQGVERVSKADVARVASQYLHPDKVRILVVGKQEDFDEPLSVLGKVNTVDITIPAPPQKLPPPTPLSLEQGRRLIELVSEACGSPDVLEKIANLQAEVELTVATPGGEMSMSGELLVVYPDRVRMVLTAPMGQVIMVVKGEEGWIKTPQGAKLMPQAQVESYRANLARDLIWVLGHWPDYKVQYLGERDFAGTRAIDLLVLDERAPFHIIADAKTLRPVGTIYREVGAEGPAEHEEELSDYRQLPNYAWVPFCSVVRVDGRKQSETRFKEVRVNVPVDPAWFEK